MNDYYVYQLRLDNSPLPFYVGKGRWNRVIQHFRPSALKANTVKNNTIKRAMQAGVLIHMEKLETDLSEGDAFALEIRLIAKYGRKDSGTGILANMTDGGDGGSGYIPSDEKRKAVSKALKGKVVSPDTCRKISEAKKGIPGKPRSTVDKANISAKLKGRPKSAETKERMRSAWLKRKQQSDY